MDVRRALGHRRDGSDVPDGRTVLDGAFAGQRDEATQLWLLGGLAAVLGVASGFVAFALVHVIGLITNIAIFHRWGWSLPPSASFPTGPGLYVAAIGGALIVSLLAKWAPIIRGHGIPEAMEAVLARESRIAPRTAIAKPMSAAVAIGTGGPFGAEGPIIVTGGALGSLAGQVLSVSVAERKILLAVGAAAGMTAIFGTPVAAVVLVIELLLFEYSTRAVIPLLVGTGVAAAMHNVLFESAPMFAVAAHGPVGVVEVPEFVGLGALCGLLAVVVTRGLFLIEAGYRRLPIAVFWHPLIGAVGFATIGQFVPGALGVGYDEIGDVLLGRLALATVTVLLVAKLAAWWVALGSGTSGGTLAPVLLIAGCFGSALGQITNELAPGLHVTPTLFALAAMAATFGAATRTPLASVLFMLELTHDLDASVALVIATVIASLVASRFLPDSLMTEKLTRRNVRVPSGYHSDERRTLTVSDIMTRDVVTIDAAASLAEACTIANTTPYTAYPIVDTDGRYLATITRDEIWRKINLVLDPELAGANPRPDTQAPDINDDTDHTTRHDTTCPTTTVRAATHQLADAGIERLIVTDNQHHLLGLCTRTDFLDAASRDSHHDQIAPGWLHHSRRRPPHADQMPPSQPPTGLKPN